MKSTILLIAIALSLITSCSSVRNVKPSINTELSFNYNFGDTLGIFKNNSNGNFEGYSLWKTLYCDSDHIKNWDSLNVRIILESKNRLSLELLNGDAIVDCRIVKGTISEKFYRLQNQRKYISYVIIAIYGDCSTKISITKSGDLLAIKNSAGILLLGGLVPIYGVIPQTLEVLYERVQ